MGESDLQAKGFKVVSCTNCGYSELYRSVFAGSNDPNRPPSAVPTTDDRDTTSGSSDIIDAFLG